MNDYDMIEFEAEFIECLYESPDAAISVWRHDGEPEGPWCEVAPLADVYVSHESIIGAMRAIPHGMTWRIVPEV